MKYLILLLILKIVSARISIEIDVDKNNKVTLNPSGVETNVITDDEVKLFKIENLHLLDALEQHYGRRPDNVYLKNPTPWGDLYKTHKWKQVSTALAIKSAKLKGISKRPVVVMSQEYENFSDRPMKMKIGVWHAVKNTFTTTWSANKEFNISQGVSYDVNVTFDKVKGRTKFSYTSNWGVSEEKSEIVQIGTDSDMELELKPRQTVTAVLSAEAGYLEIEVVHKISLKGNLAVNFKEALKGHHFMGPRIRKVMKSGDIKNEITTVETIKVGFNVNASLKVYDKDTGSPL